MCGSQNIWLKKFGNVVFVIKECVKICVMLETASFK